MIATTNHSDILSARNRTKRQHKTYLHEATINMLNGYCGGSVSENICAIVNAFLQQIGKDMDFLDPATRSQITAIRRAITSFR
jgi:hypothetical protein